MCRHALKPGRTVSQFVKAAAEDAYTRLIAPAAERELRGSLTDRELEQLERIHAAFVDACGRNDGTDAITQDSLFHDAIVRGAHNEYVEEFSHTMILHIQRIKYHYFHCDRLRKISVSQHGEILQTIQARDSARAKELMRSHWLCSMENSLRDVAGMIHGVGGESGQDVLTK